MNEQEFNELIKQNNGLYLVKRHFIDLTEEQKKIAFNNAIKNKKGHYLIEYCFHRFTNEENKIAFEDAIERGWGYYLFKYFLQDLKKLGQEYVDRAVNNGIENNWSDFLLAFCSDKLTPEQIRKCKKQLKSTSIF